MKEKTQTNRINKMSLPFVGSHEKYSIPLIIRYNAIIRESPIRPLWIRRLREYFLMKRSIFSDKKLLSIINKLAKIWIFIEEREKIKIK